VLDFHRWLKPQSAVFKALSEKGELFYGKNMAPYFTDLLSTEERFENIIHNQQETIGALHDTHQSLLSANLNNIIAVLTVFSVVALPAIVLPTIWGMNQKFLPLRDGPYDFWIVVVLIAVMTATLLWYFRRRRWL
jgi:magnesium transporter